MIPNIKISLCYLAFSFQLLQAASGVGLFSLEEPLQMQAESATQKTMTQDYEGALASVKKLELSNKGVACVLKSIILISRYDDLGDTLDLQKAATDLNNCQVKGAWDALRNFQLGFVQSQMGHSVKGAFTTRNAAGFFKNNPDIDARGLFSIYAYYVDNSFSWLPFVSDQRELHLKNLNHASQESKLFWPLFSTSLIWMYYDRGDFEKGLEITELVLSKYPQHAVFLQIKADMLYKMNRHDEALKIYLSSAAEYHKKTGQSIRYWCSVANLVKIYKAKGDAEQSALWQQRLLNDGFNRLKKWIPSSVLEGL